MINLHNKSLADAANTEKRVFRKLSVEEAHLANALADKTKQYGFKHWDEYYPTLEIFELDAAAGELFGCFVMFIAIVLTQVPTEVFLGKNKRRIKEN